MTNLIVIYGAHGAGKSSLVRNILKANELIEKENEFGKYTLSGNFVAVGKYDVKCGGADGLKGTEYYYKILNQLIQDYPQKTIIIEGIFLSGLFSRPLKEFLALKYDKNVNITQVFLFTDAKTSYVRVVNRNGKKPKISNIIAKVNSVFRTFKKFQELNEFKCVAINTVDKSESEVFTEFCDKVLNND